MKELLEYIVKNKYIIICVAIVIVLYSLNVLTMILEFVIFLGLIVAAMYTGKKLQENEGKINKVFKSIFKYSDKEKDSTVYYYQDKDKK